MQDNKIHRHNRVVENLSNFPIRYILDRFGSIRHGNFPGKGWGKEPVETRRHTVYVYRAGLAELAGGPHYVGFPAAQPSYLFNVSFALVTIQIGPSLSMRCQPPSLPISLVFSLIIWKPMFNNALREYTRPYL